MRLPPLIANAAKAHTNASAIAPLLWLLLSANPPLLRTRQLFEDRLVHLYEMRHGAAVAQVCVWVRVRARGEQCGVQRAARDPTLHSDGSGGD